MNDDGVRKSYYIHSSIRPAFRIQFVNTTLSSLHLPLRLVDGYIGKVTATIPWKKLLDSSCVMEINRLEITLESLETVAGGDAGKKATEPTAAADGEEDLGEDE